MGKRIGRTALAAFWVLIGVGFCAGHGVLLLVIGIIIILSALGDLVRVWRVA